jgi:hypothetical protein
MTAIIPQASHNATLYLIYFYVYNLFRLNLIQGTEKMKEHHKAKSHMEKAAMHHEKAAKHHEMAKKAMGGLVKDKEKMMAKKGDKKGSKYP